MYCYRCRTQNPDQALFCKHCHAPFDTVPPQTYPVPPQRSGLKWWHILLIVLSVIFIVNIGTGFFLFGDDTTFELFNLFNGITSDDTLYELNEPASFQSIEITVTEVKHSGALGFTDANNDTEVVTVYLTVKNIGEIKLLYDPENYRMANSMGQLISPHIDYDSLSYSAYYELLPGGRADIALQFEQPIDDPELELQYYYFSSETPTLRFEIE